MKCEFCGNYLNIVKCADDYTELRLEDESIFKINWGVSFFFFKYWNWDVWWGLAVTCLKTIIFVILFGDTKMQLNEECEWTHMWMMAVWIGGNLWSFRWNFVVTDSMQV